MWLWHPLSLKVCEKCCTTRWWSWIRAMKTFPFVLRPSVFPRLWHWAWFWILSRCTLPLVVRVLFNGEEHQYLKVWNCWIFGLRLWMCVCVDDVVHWLWMCFWSCTRFSAISVVVFFLLFFIFSCFILLKYFKLCLKSFFLAFYTMSELLLSLLIFYFIIIGVISPWVS